MADLPKVDVPRELPVVPVRGVVVFPGAVQPFAVPLARTLAAVGATGDALCLVVAQRQPEVESPGLRDLYEVGTVARLLRFEEHAGGGSVAVVAGLARARVVSEAQTSASPGSVTEPAGSVTEPGSSATVPAPAPLRAVVERLEDVGTDEDAPETRALIGNIRDVAMQVIASSPVLSNQLIAQVHHAARGSMLADVVGSFLPSLDTPSRQRLLETLDVLTRLRAVHEALVRELEELELRQRIQAAVEERLGKAQREVILREQMRAIRSELGEADAGERLAEELRARIEAAKIPEPALAEANRELERLRRLPTESAEASVARTYLEWMTALPWAKTTAIDVDLARAQAILDEDHFDLEKVKERIVEYLAVGKLRRDTKGPLLCFVGPPGTGKTSIGRSIARATGRAFVRISLGGMHDEAEIRGHRRTYVGALPGQIIQGMRRAGTRDPVFMLDELDKLGKDFRGDPGAALMEVLDPEQNAAFRDHYLDVPFDLSRVLFITTANVLAAIPPALVDRVEVLDLAGYTDEEKVEIARRYLLPREARENGIELGKQIEFGDDALRAIIRGYTHEAGVRGLERAIATVCRKHARTLASGGEGRLEVTPEVVHARLGPPRFLVESELATRTRKPGTAVALAWTPQGGDILFVEAARMPRDRSELVVTGHLGDVMQESVLIALSWVRANAERLGIDAATFRASDLHVHVPSGGVPKDGPSAGLVMIMALVSLFLDRPVRPFVAMTGEVTLRGDVLPVGGIKEKVLAAERSGVRELVLPEANRANVEEELPESLRKGCAFLYVATIEEAIACAFEPAVLPGAERKRVTDGAFEPMAAGSG